MLIRSLIFNPVLEKLSVQSSSTPSKGKNAKIHTVHTFRGKVRLPAVQREEELRNYRLPTCKSAFSHATLLNSIWIYSESFPITGQISCQSVGEQAQQRGVINSAVAASIQPHRPSHPRLNARGAADRRRRRIRTEPNPEEKQWLIDEVSLFGGHSQNHSHSHPNLQTYPNSGISASTSQSRQSALSFEVSVTTAAPFMQSVAYAAPWLRPGQGALQLPLRACIVA